MPKPVACGSREATWKRFVSASRTSRPNERHLLLVDSEGPIESGSDVWSHLKQRDDWVRPDGVDDDSAHLMVQCMEAWFLADRAALAAYFGNGFNVSSLPVGDIESLSKDRLFDGLKNATREVKTEGKRRYVKGDHSFQILAKLDATKVIAASPHATKLIEAIKKRSS